MDLKKNKKIINVYSITDWDYHKRMVNWDDLFDEKGKFFLTIATMEMAKEDGFYQKILVKIKSLFLKEFLFRKKIKAGLFMKM